jgi:hypothetical protein
VKPFTSLANILRNPGSSQVLCEGSGG